MLDNLDLNKVYFGNDDAERDDKNGFLRQVFIKTSFYYRVLEKKRELVVGRKGSGKSAICLILKSSLESDGYNVSLITPDSLSKQRIQRIESNSVTREEIYLLAWRYILLVKASLSFISLVDDLKISRLRYDNNIVREIRTFLGKNEEIETGFAQNLASLVNVINKIQVNVLGSGGAIEKSSESINKDKLVDLIPNFEGKLSTGLKYIGDGQNTIFLLIDKVDEIWNENEESKLMISGLIRAVKQFNDKFKNAYAVTFLRSDIFDTLKFHDIDKTPGQEEILVWNHETIKQLLDVRAYISLTNKRLENYWQIKSSTSKSTLVLDNLFCSKMYGKQSIDYILDRTLLRPREAIQFCNLALNIAQDKGHNLIFEEDILQAEHRYSEWKLRDLISEFQIQYPHLDVLLPMFNGFKFYFHRHEFFHRFKESREKLRTICPHLISYEDSTILKEFYEIGLIGILKEKGKTVYSHLENSFKREFKDDKSSALTSHFIIHPAYRFALKVVNDDNSFTAKNTVEQIIAGNNNITGNVVSSGKYSSINQTINIDKHSREFVRDSQDFEPDKDINSCLNMVASELTLALRLLTPENADLGQKKSQVETISNVLDFIEGQVHLKSSLYQILAEDKVSQLEEMIDHELAPMLIPFLNQ